MDTPRAADQFGSLVVCLPLEHEGGALEVRHEGNSIAFDWGKGGKSEDGAFVQWAAFYSDCEHEVLEVTSGHRLTLTYNLYAIRGNGLLAGHCQTLDAAQLPLYKQVVDVLKEDSFMTKGMSDTKIENQMPSNREEGDPLTNPLTGGFLGFYCQHAYPHSSRASGLPDTLKGIDMMLYEIFRALGYKVDLRPVLKDPFADCYGKGTKGKTTLHIGGSLQIHECRLCGIEDSYEFLQAMDSFRSGKCKDGTREFHESDIVWVTQPDSKHEEAQFVYAAVSISTSSLVRVYVRLTSCSMGMRQQLRYCILTVPSSSRFRLGRSAKPLPLFLCRAECFPTALNEA